MIDTYSRKDISSPEEVAEFFGKSLSWVYRNQKELGGRKLGGCLFFPGKEQLYVSLFGYPKEVEIRLHPEGETVHEQLLQDQGQSNGSRGQKKGGDKESKTSRTSQGGDCREDPNRHGLFGSS